jgi:hypothetical protein
MHYEIYVYQEIFKKSMPVLYVSLSITQPQTATDSSGLKVDQYISKNPSSLTLFGI